MGAWVIGVGDWVVTRQNDRGLTTDRDHWVRNRDTFIVINVTKADITVSGPTGTAKLPADYVKAHVELGYAQTSHASQGRTVDHSLLVVAEGDTPDRAGVYVPMTRGRHTNRAVVVTDLPELGICEPALGVMSGILDSGWWAVPSIMWPDPWLEPTIPTCVATSCASPGEPPIIPPEPIIEPALVS